jgi:hypothetical protein
MSGYTLLNSIISLVNNCLALSIVFCKQKVQRIARKNT